MLRINLLPSYVQQRRLTKRLVPPFILLFALCVAAPLAGYIYERNQLAKLTQDANAAVTGKSTTDALKTQATTTIAQVAPIQAKLQFVDDCYDHIRQVVALWNRLADTTPKSSFIYTGASVSGTTMSIKAYTPSVEEVGRYLQVMYHEPDFVTVAVDHIPAYPENVRHLYFLHGVLVFADGASGGGAATQGSYGGGGQGGSGSYPGGQGGGYPSGGQGSGQQGGGQASAGAPANWTPDALGPNGPSNIPAGVGPPPSQLTGGAGTGNTQGQGGNTQGGSAGGYSERFLQIAGKGISPFASPAVREQIYAKKLRQVVPVTVPKGFDINVTATLKQALTLPSLPGAAPAGGASGPGRGPGGPGGYPGSSGPPSSASSSG